MRTEIKNWKLVCDRCGHVEMFSSRFESDLPKDWARVTTHGWGMTNYSRTEDRCPECKDK